MASARPQQDLTDADLQAFFNDPSNYAGVQLEEALRRLGPPTQYDDWDWGRIVYDWQRPSCRYILITRGGYVKAAEELDACDTSRFGTTVRVIWGDASP